MNPLKRGLFIDPPATLLRKPSAAPIVTPEECIAVALTCSQWKPAGFRRDIVKACALIVAEGEKFDRQRRPRKLAVVGEGAPEIIKLPAGSRK